jgi:excisionase family DNA binding protein
MVSDTMTTNDAARLLGVSVRQVQRLADAERLDVVDHVGRTALLDAASVHKLARLGTARGRSWYARTVWAAIAMLDGDNRAALSNPSQLWHLRNRVRHMDADDLVRSAGSRATVIRYRASTSYLDQLAEHITLTGASAVDADPQLAQHFGLAGARAATLEGYVAAGQVAELEHQFFFVRDTAGNVTLHVTDGDPQTGRIASTATVSLDLAESLDPRQRAAGLRVLNGMMQAL